jgi:DsbC/DsbD-like thiol-disulfide interchange protein
MYRKPFGIRPHLGEVSAMNRTRLASAAVLLTLPLLIAGALCGPARAADPKESKDAVKITATAEKADGNGNQNVVITLDIDPKWHLYANPVKNDDMVSAQTVVKLAAGAKLDDVKITYPPGKQKKDSTGTYDIYEGKIEIKAVVRRAKDDNSPLDASIQVSACDEVKCLLPSTIKIKVEPK